MKETPIIYSTDMVRAYLEGRKTMTRRTRGLEEINKCPNEWVQPYQLACEPCLWTFRSLKSGEAMTVKCPYGQVGDKLWGKESLYRNPYFDEAGYIADQTPVMVNQTIGDMLKWRWKRDILPAMFMPKEASRITQTITGVRAERLQEISGQDIKAEGLDVQFTITGAFDALERYETLWDSLNAKRGYPWTGNWWVWVISYPAYQAKEQHG